MELTRHGYVEAIGEGEFRKRERLGTEGGQEEKEGRRVGKGGFESARRGGRG